MRPLVASFALTLVGKEMNTRLSASPMDLARALVDPSASGHFCLGSRLPKETDWITNACSSSVPKMPIRVGGKNWRRILALGTMGSGESCQSPISIFLGLSIGLRAVTPYRFVKSSDHSNRNELSANRGLSNALTPKKEVTRGVTAIQIGRVQSSNNTCRVNPEIKNAHRSLTMDRMSGASPMSTVSVTMVPEQRCCSASRWRAQATWRRLDTLTPPPKRTDA